MLFVFFFFPAEDGIRGRLVTGVQTCALPILVALIAFAPATAIAGPSNSLMDISADGKLLACSNRDSGTVTIVSLDDHKVVREVKVGGHPEGVSFIGDTHNVAVAVYDDDQIVMLNAHTGPKIGIVDVFDEPSVVVSTADGSKPYVTLDYPGQIVEIDTASRKQIRSIDAGPFARGLALDPDEKRLYVTEFYTSTVRAIDIESGKPVIVPRISGEPLFLDRTGARAETEKSQTSFICVPILLQRLVSES